MITSGAVNAPHQSVSHTPVEWRCKTSRWQSDPPRSPTPRPAPNLPQCILCNSSRLSFCRSFCLSFFYCLHLCSQTVDTARGGGAGVYPRRTVGSEPFLRKATKSSAAWLEKTSLQTYFTIRHDTCLKQDSGSVRLLLPSHKPLAVGLNERPVVHIVVN